MKIDLEMLCGPIEGFHAATLEGDPYFIASLRSEYPLAPDCRDAPLLVSFRPESAPEMEYQVWASWLPPGTDLGTNFAPLLSWRKAFTKSTHKIPILALARAQGRWDLPPLQDPRLSALLGERDPSGFPEGRVLLLAEDPSAPCEAPARTLARGLRAFASSINPWSSVPLPEFSMLIRSGHKTLDLSAEASFRIHFLERGSAKPDPSQPDRSLSLPSGIRPYATIRGAMLWGAWRGAEGAMGFVSSTCRASGGLRFQLGIRYGGSPLTLPRLTELIAELLNHPDRGMHPGVASEDLEKDPSLRRILARALRTAESVVSKDPLLLGALETPYRLLHQHPFPGTPSVSEAASFPGTILLPGGGSDAAPEEAPGRLPFGFVPFSRSLRRHRDLALVARYSQELAASGSSPGFVSLSRAYGLPAPGPLPSARAGKIPPKPRTWRFSSGFVPGKSLSKQKDPLPMAAKTGRKCPVERVYEAACGHGSGSGDGLHAAFEADRPRGLMMALLPEVARWAGMPWPPPPEVEAYLADCRRIRFRLETSVPEEALWAWQNLADEAEPNLARLRQAAFAVQRTLRVLLAVAVMRCETSADNSFLSRNALLVHRHAMHYIGPKRYEIVADPHEDVVLRRTARGARFSLRRKSAAWKAMLRNAAVRHDRRGAIVFSEDRINACLDNPAPLRRILLEEAELCRQVERLVHSAAARRFSRKRDLPVSPREARSMASPFLRAAQRLHPISKTGQLAGILIAAASGALAGEPGRKNQWPRIRLSLQPLDAGSIPLAPAIFLDARGIHAEPEGDGADVQGLGEGSGRTRAA